MFSVYTMYASRFNGNWGMIVRQFTIFALATVAYLTTFAIPVSAVVTDIGLGYGKTAAPGTYPNTWVRDERPEAVTPTYQRSDKDIYFSAGQYVYLSIGFSNIDIPAAVLIDTITLEGPSGLVAVNNGGFENGASGWSARGGINADGAFTIDTDAHEGFSAALLTLNNSDYYALYTQTPVAITESGTYTLSVFTKVVEPPRDIPPDTIFALEEGNSWTYDTNIQRVVTRLDVSTFGRDTFEVTAYSADTEIAKQWFEVWKGYLRLWGEAAPTLFKFTFGLYAAWTPMTADESKSASAWVTGYNTTVDLQAKVIGVEEVELPFETIETTRLRYNYIISGPGGTTTTTYDWWIAPYLGVVKQQSSSGTDTLVSFALGGGTITPTSDNDKDDLLDYKELMTYHTDPLMQDTDQDGCSDGDEYNGNRDPLIPDPEGDLNMDCEFGIADAVTALKMLAVMPETGLTGNGADLDNDNRIGLGEVIFVLQRLSELR